MEKRKCIKNEKVWGYCRISTPQQNIERQIRNIKREHPEAIIVTEKYTGTKMDRPEWNRLYLQVQKSLNKGENVKIIFDSVSRMSRNAEEGIETYFEMFKNGVELCFIKEAYINTSVYASSLSDKIKLQGTDVDEIFKGINNYFRKLAEQQIRIAFEQAQKEVDDLHQRTREGIETARLAGKQIGQRKGAKLYIKKEATAKAIITKHSKMFGGTLSDKECMKLARVSEGTYYKYKKQLKNQGI